MTETTIASCTPSSQAKGKRADQDPSCIVQDAIVYPLTQGDTTSIKRILDANNLDYDTIESTAETGYYWVQNLPFNIKTQLLNNPAVASVYYYAKFNQDNPRGPADILNGMPSPDPFDADDALRDKGLITSEPLTPHLILNETLEEFFNTDKLQLWKRASIRTDPIDYFNPALVSHPPAVTWKGTDRDLYTGPRDRRFIFYYDDSAGEGMTIYTIGEIGMCKSI